MWRQLKKELEGLSKAEEDRIQKVFQRVDVNQDGRIDSEDLAVVLARLHYEPKKFEIEDMIWEVDEDLDRAVTYDEFLLMYRRVRNDKTGLEPRKLYNVIDFVMHDTDDDGHVSVDECFSIMFLRHGKFFSEADVRKLFKGSTDNGNTVSFTEFLVYLHDQHAQLAAQQSATGKGAKGETKK